MEITNIKGNTYYIKGGTNTGIYLLENNEAVMIDPGLYGTRAKRVIEKLEANNIALKYIINTHEHNDHYGACKQFKEYYKDLEILSSSYAKMYIEHPELFSKYIIGGKSNIFLDDKLKGKIVEFVKIDKIIDSGSVNIGDIPFEIIPMQGHTPGSIGIMTKDKVIFVGDVLIGEKILKKYDFLFLYDVEAQIISLNRLKDIDFDYLILGHGKEIISKKDSYDLIKKNEDAIKKYLYQIRELLKRPMTLENLLKYIIQNNNLSNNYKEYHFLKSSLVSVISYLTYLEEIGYILEQGELLYYTKRK